LGVAGTDVFELTVRDTGLGMSEATLQRAFEPFFTTRPKGQAAGLGLTIVHSVARLHGGQVTLESAEDAGTTVRIWIPVVEYTAESRAAAASPAATPARRAAGLKVLLVDDDPMVREVVKACLQKARFDVQTATDGNEGLKLFQRHAKDIALVISDVTMPNLNGVEMVRQVLQTHPDVPLLMISGDADDKLARSLADLGSHAPPLLKKPFTVKALLAEVKRLAG
ncbi:MAG: response regulator, partial [Verrucomicrobia bacterium]|nr:response regulator [Verrucomicrobiota bacterium]